VRIPKPVADSSKPESGLKSILPAAAAAPPDFGFLRFPFIIRALRGVLQRV
jgi:hypothetical protein